MKWHAESYVHHFAVATAHLGGTSFGTGGVIHAETARQGRRGRMTDLALGARGAVRRCSCEHAKIDCCRIEVVFGTLSFVIGQRRRDALLGLLPLFGIFDELAGGLCPAPADGGESEPRSFRESSATGMLAHMRRVPSFSRYREVVHVVAGCGVAVRRTGSGALERQQHQGRAGGCAHGWLAWRWVSLACTSRVESRTSSRKVRQAKRGPGRRAGLTQRIRMSFVSNKCRRRIEVRHSGVSPLSKVRLSFCFPFHQ